MADEHVLLNIDEMVGKIHSVTERPFCIFRVPAHIRSYKNNRCYFEPRVVSIGPYHRNKEHLRAMEMHKWRYLCDLFEKGGRNRREEYVTKMRDLVPSIRKCYFENTNDLTDDDKLTQMLLLDGCFILQFLIKLYNLKNLHDYNNDPVFRVDWNLPLISTDLLMLENQIPFSVLKTLYEIYSYGESSQTPGLDILLLKFVKRVEHRRKKEVVTNFSIIKQTKGDLWADEIQHLLHFYYIAYTPVLESNNSPKGTSFISRALSSLSYNSRPQGENYPLEDRSLVDTLHQKDEARGLKETDFPEKIHYPRMIPCATELQEFGITFKMHEKPKNFFDICFVGGVLKIPCFSIEDSTKPKYMNLVAFEQSNGMKNKYVTSYVFFMDFLLNSRKDVIVLQRFGIIENKLANEDEVVEFFTQLHGCCYMKFNKHYLAPVFRDVKAYCESIWPKHRAKLHRDYFSNPWAIISFGAGLLVIGITIFRTVCFILSVFFHYHLN